MGNRHYRQDRAILEVSNKRQKMKSKQTKELNAFMVGLDGAGKSTILYKHMARSTYSFTQMQIPQTITYNMETIRPKQSLLTTQKQRQSMQSMDKPMAPIPPIPQPIGYSINSHSPSFNLRHFSQQQCQVIQQERIHLNIYDYGGGKSTRQFWSNFKQLKIQKLQQTGNRIDFFILVVDCTDLDRLNDEYNDSVQLAMKELLNMKQYVHIPLCIFANKQDLHNAISSLILPYRLGIKQLTVWSIIAHVKYLYDLNLEYKISKKILSFLPNINFHWNMSQRHWSMFDTETVSDYCKGISDGIQWLYNEYDRANHGKANKAIQRRMSFAPRFGLTV